MLRAILLALLGATIAALVAHTVALQVEYFDGYSNLNNALALLADPIGRYAPIRTLLPVLLQLPAMAARRFDVIEAPLLLPHLTSLAVTLAGVLCAARFARGGAGFAAAAGAALLLLWNRLVLHYAPFALPEPATLLTVALVLLSGLRASCAPTRRNLTLAGVALALAALARHQNLIFAPALVLFWLLGPRWVRSGERPEPLGTAQLAVVGIVAILVWNGAYSLADLARGEIRASTPIAGFRAAWKVFEFNRTNEAMRALHPGGPLFFLAVIQRAGGWAGALVCVAGAAMAARRGTARDLLALGAGLVWLLANSAAPNPEARYAIAVLPMTTYATAVALDGLFDRLRAASARPRALAAAALAGIAAAAAHGAAAEVRRWTEPAYRVGRAPRLAEVIEAELGRGGEVFWVGSGVISTFPTETLLHPADPFHQFFHLDPSGLAYHLRRPVSRLGGRFRPDLLDRLRGLPRGSLVLVVDGRATTGRHPPQPAPVRMLAIDGPAGGTPQTDAGANLRALVVPVSWATATEARRAESEWSASLASAFSGTDR